MRLDIKLPIGLFFSIIGFVLVLSGILDKQKIVLQLGYNFNLWWGVIILVFGVLMLLLYFIKKEKNS
jgi:hypothetical protein